ncbi:MAG: phosphomannomutase/phosphoglucomutase [Candidatus Woesebacteria bacterium]|nr:phosphomannomutase/phosphoglucomutase [Candidatus Woesebacteria bacterium]
MVIDPSIFKAYDIRGIFPQSFDNDLAYKIGRAYAEVVKPQDEILVGHDVRIHSEELKQSLIQGLIDSGIDVLDVGWMSTDMLYFGVGTYKTSGGIQVTASHNPPEWHGMKMVRENAIPMTLESGIADIRDYVLAGNFNNNSKKGKVRKIYTIVDDYSKYILKWIDPTQIKPMKIVYNPNFGFAGKIFEKIIEIGKLPIELIPLNEIPNGNFPKGRPDPFIPENRTEFVELVKNSKADLGIAWDADADRVFFCADGGIFSEPYYVNPILIKQMLKKHPNEKIIYDPRYTWGLIESIENSGGEAVLVRVGHSYIKEAMRKHNALFATESSGHTYYRDYWYSDCGMIPVMQVLEYLSENNLKLSDEVRQIMNKYFISGEINNVVNDKEGKMKEIEKKYKDAKQSKLDGIAVEYEDYRFCVRPSNTEPLLRLTLEAKSKELMEEKRDEVLKLIKS